MIVFAATDPSYGDLSCYGATRVTTSKSDSITNAGVRFTDTHAEVAKQMSTMLSELRQPYATDTGCLYTAELVNASVDVVSGIKPPQPNKNDITNKKNGTMYITTIGETVRIYNMTGKLMPSNQWAKAGAYIIKSEKQAIKVIL